jgi:squalene synthase HpnC
MSFAASPSPKFAPHYHAWGPETSSTASLVEARKYCQKLASAHYENFSVVSWLLPKPLQQHFYNVYAFCRWSDDLGDELQVAPGTVHPLTWWRNQTTNILQETPKHPVLLALKETVLAYNSPLQPVLDLLSAFEQDQIQTTYTDFTKLLNYCERSANPVGKSILYLAECPTPENLVFSDSICTGLQLANFWQDVRRDRLAGRVYLPRDDMRRHGVDEAMLDAPAASAALKGLLRDEVAWARSCFDAGAPLVGLAPRVLRPAIGMFLAGGRAVADAIERAGFDTLVRRPTVPRATKLRLAARAWWGATWAGLFPGGPR